MKFLLAGATFFMTLGLTFQTLAGAPAGDEKCQAESPTCAEPAAGAHGAGGHHGVGEKMNSLYPEKQQDPSRSLRPGVTQTVSPAFLAEVGAGTVKLEWKAVETATEYHVQVATDPHFKWLVLNEHFVKSNTLDFTQAESGKRYFWRVASRKADNKAMTTKSNFASSAFNVK